MADLLYLVHRIPYPPNKGDKLRSYHLLRHLAARHRVHLGCFIDDPADLAHVDALRPLCSALHVAELAPRRARIASLAGLWRGEPLTLAYYRDESMARWVGGLRASGRIDASVVFSSSMAQYAEPLDERPVLVDFVDVDSAKWTQYAGERPWPLSWLYRREGVELLRYERRVAASARRSFFVTDRESELFRRAAPECADRVETLGNGVDTDHFAPEPQRPNPYAEGELPVVFTGAMDYWPNIDAVTWFAREVLPGLLRRWPALSFHIVGRAPPPSVRALASAHVHVSGTVPDVRPYLQHAAVVVAPLRVARGIQNKILEAMAMARPVVAARDCVDATEARAGDELLAAVTPADYVAQIAALIESPARAAAIGAAGRAHVRTRCSWAAQLAGIDRHLDALASERSAAA